MSDRTIDLNEEDRKILREIQKDCTLSMERIAKRINSSKTTVWNRIQRMMQNGTILRQAAIVDPVKIGLKETFFVSVKTSRHEIGWLEDFKKVIESMPEITEAHRLSGPLDYLLKVQVSSTNAFDDFYKDLVSRIAIHDVSSSLSMEVMKRSLELKPVGE